MNEASVIESVVQALVANEFRVLVVDDGSLDATGKISKDAGAMVISHMVNCGQGASLETGFDAIRRGVLSSKLIATFDADGQHSVTDLHAMLEEFNLSPSLEVVLGSRFLHDNIEVPRIKALLLRTAAFLARLTIGIKISDRHNGIRMLKTHVLTDIRLAIPGYGHADEILVSIARAGLEYKEVPVHIAYTPYSKSKGQPLINAFRILFDNAMERR